MAAITIKSRGEKVFGVFNSFFMVLIAIVCLYPMLYILFASLSEPDALLQHSGILVAPLGWNFAAYLRVARNSAIGTGYLNTLFYVGIGTLTRMVMTILCAFVLTRKSFMLSKPMNIMVVITMFFNGGLIPTYLVVQWVGLLNNRWALIIPSVINVFNMIILRTNFNVFPGELEDSARIDGANEFQFLTRVLLPLSKAALAVITLYYAVSQWNSWLPAVLYLRDRIRYPLQLILREILLQNDMSVMQDGGDIAEDLAVAATIKYATIIVSTAPILILYPFVQKYFVKGVMVGALKG